MSGVPVGKVRGVSVFVDGKQYDFPSASRWFANKHGHIEVIGAEIFYEAGKCSFSTHKSLGYFGRFDRVFYMDEVKP